MANNFVNQYASGTDFNGAKTLAQIPITQPPGAVQATIAANLLQINGGTQGYLQDFALFAPSNLFPRVSADIPDIGAMAGAAHIILRWQPGGSCYILRFVAAGMLMFSLPGPNHINPQEGGIPAGTPAGGANANAFPALSGAATITGWLTPGKDGSTNFFGSVKAASDPKTYLFALYNQFVGPNVAGSSGVGASVGLVTFSRVSVDTDQGVTLAGPAAANLLIDDGDSITRGYLATDNGTDGSTGTSYPARLAVALGAAWEVINTGVFARLVTAMAGAVNSEQVPFLAGSYTNKLGTLLGGINDVKQGATATDVQSAIQAYHTAKRNAGSKQIASTMLDTTSLNANTRPIWTAINAWLRANWQTFADGFVDLATTAGLTDPTDATIFPDGIHLSDVGYQRIANAFLPTIQQIAPTTDPYPAAPASLTAAAPQASAVLTWPAAANSTGYRVRRDGVTAPIYAGPLLTFTDTFALGTSHTYTVTAYNTAGESALTSPVTATAITTSLSLTVTPGTGVNNLAWLSDPLAANGYAVLWMPGSALPVVGGTGEVVARVAQGTLTWADTSAYRIGLSAGSRYDVISLR